MSAIHDAAKRGDLDTVKDLAEGYELHFISDKEFSKLEDHLKNQAYLIKNENGRYTQNGFKDGKWQLTKLEDNFKLPDEWLDQQKVFVSPRQKIYHALKKNHISLKMEVVNELHEKWKTSPFAFALQGGRYDVCEYLESLGADLNSGILHPTFFIKDISPKETKIKIVEYLYRLYCIDRLELDRYAKIAFLFIINKISTSNLEKNKEYPLDENEINSVVYYFIQFKEPYFIKVFQDRYGTQINPNFKYKNSPGLAWEAANLELWDAFDKWHELKQEIDLNAADEDDVSVVSLFCRPSHWAKLKQIYPLSKIINFNAKIFPKSNGYQNYTVGLIFTLENQWDFFPNPNTLPMLPLQIDLGARIDSPENENQGIRLDWLLVAKGQSKLLQCLIHHNYGTYQVDLENHPLHPNHSSKDVNFQDILLLYCDTPELVGDLFLQHISKTGKAINLNYKSSYPNHSIVSIMGYFIYKNSRNTFIKLIHQQPEVINLNEKPLGYNYSPETIAELTVPSSSRLFHNSAIGCLGFIINRNLELGEKYDLNMVFTRLSGDLLYLLLAEKAISTIEALLPEQPTIINLSAHRLNFLFSNNYSFSLLCQIIKRNVQLNWNYRKNFTSSFVWLVEYIAKGNKIPSLSIPFTKNTYEVDYHSCYQAQGFYKTSSINLIDKIQDSGETLLHTAVNNEKPEDIFYLLWNKANFSIPDKNGNTVIDLIIKKNQKLTMDLIKTIIWFNNSLKDFYDILMSAFAKNNREITKFLQHALFDEWDSLRQQDQNSFKNISMQYINIAASCGDINRIIQLFSTSPNIKKLYDNSPHNAFELALLYAPLQGKELHRLLDLLWNDQILKDPELHFKFLQAIERQGEAVVEWFRDNQPIIFQMEFHYNLFYRSIPFFTAAIFRNNHKTLEILIKCVKPLLGLDQPHIVSKLLPLHFAARHGSLAVLKLVFNAYSNGINAISHEDKTPLTEAVDLSYLDPDQAENQLEKVRFLLENGADVNKLSIYFVKKKCTYLSWIIENCSYYKTCNELVKLFLQYDTTTKLVPIFIKMYNSPSQKKLVDLFLQTPRFFSETDDNRNTILDIALFPKNKEFLEFLKNKLNDDKESVVLDPLIFTTLLYGYNFLEGMNNIRLICPNYFNRYDANLDTLLHRLIKSGEHNSSKVVPLFREYQVRIDVKNKQGKSPFHLALIHSGPVVIDEMCHYALQNNINIIDESCYELAAKDNHFSQQKLCRLWLTNPDYKFANWLVNNKINLHLPPLQTTPLHVAVKEKKFHVIDGLIQNGADINSHDKSHCIPSFYGCSTEIKLFHYIKVLENTAEYPNTFLSFQIKIGFSTSQIKAAAKALRAFILDPSCASLLDTHQELLLGDKTLKVIIEEMRRNPRYQASLPQFIKQAKFSMTG